MNFLVRMKWKQLGRHIHVRVFVGKGTLTLAKSGDLVFEIEEWEQFKQNLHRFMEPGSDIEVVPDS